VQEKTCTLGCRSGHVFVDGRWVRCKCLNDEIYGARLGLFKTQQYKRDSPVVSCLDRNVVFEGTISGLRPHVAGALVKLIDEGRSFHVLDAYSLVDIFLDKDQDIPALGHLVDSELLVLLMGFGDVKNQRLPELISQLLVRRELLSKPVWVILAITLDQLAMRYSEAVRNQISLYRRVVVK